MIADAVTDSRAGLIATLPLSSCGLRMSLPIRLQPSRAQKCSGIVANAIDVSYAS
jgi:hypothetical protein